MLGGIIGRAPNSCLISGQLAAWRCNLRATAELPFAGEADLAKHAQQLLGQIQRLGSMGAPPPRLDRSPPPRTQPPQQHHQQQYQHPPPSMMQHQQQHQQQAHPQQQPPHRPPPPRGPPPPHHMPPMHEGGGFRPGKTSVLWRRKVSLPPCCLLPFGFMAMLAAGRGRKPWEFICIAVDSE
jgi:hypothetical protein